MHIPVEDPIAEAGGGDKPKISQGRSQPVPSPGAGLG
jgi:hypothetical protein